MDLTSDWLRTIPGTRDLMTASRMRVSVVICTHERHDLCRKAIDSLIPQVDGEKFELIVVDNSVDRDAAERFSSRFAETAIRFIHTTSVGLSNARNIGAQAAQAPIVAYLDDDAVAEPGWVGAIAAAFEANAPNAGVVGGLVRPIWIEPPPAWMSERFLESIAIIDRGPRMRALAPDEWLAGCNIAFNREALLDVGGFDSKLGRIGKALLSNEETAVCDRIRASGRSIIYAPDVVVGHVISPERASVEYVRRRVAWQAVSDALTYPQRARDRAITNHDKRNPIGRMLQMLRLYRLLRRGRTTMTRKDYDTVYEFVNQLLCHDDDQHDERNVDLRGSRPGAVRTLLRSLTP